MDGSSSAIIWIPVIVALVTALAAVINAIITGKGNRDLERDKIKANERLERKKFESTLILQAVTVSDQEQALKNLKFFARAKLITVSEDQLKTLDENPENTPI